MCFAQRAARNDQFLRGLSFIPSPLHASLCNIPISIFSVLFPHVHFTWQKIYLPIDLWVDRKYIYLYPLFIVSCACARSSLKWSRQRVNMHAIHAGLYIEKGNFTSFLPCFKHYHKIQLADVLIMNISLTLFHSSHVHGPELHYCVLLWAMTDSVQSCLWPKLNIVLLVHF